MRGPAGSGSRLTQGHRASKENWPCEATQRCAMPHDGPVWWHWEASDWLGTCSPLREGVVQMKQPGVLSPRAISNQISIHNGF